MILPFTRFKKVETNPKRSHFSAHENKSFSPLFFNFFYGSILGGYRIRAEIVPNQALHKMVLKNSSVGLLRIPWMTRWRNAS